MRTPQQIADRVRAIRSRNAKRDQDYLKLIAIRKGDYEFVAPGLFNTAEFDKPLVANLVETTARDIAEVKAPLPSFNCHSTNLANAAEEKRQDKRGNIANYYVQNSRLQDQMFAGADREGSFGFLAYIVEPDFIDQTPVIRIGSNPMASYTQDYRGRTKEYFEVGLMTAGQLRADYGDKVAGRLRNAYDQECEDTKQFEVVRHYDEHSTTLMVLDPCIVLASTPNRMGRCPVRVVERPSVTGETRGQFDDVIWVQVARALVAMYTMNAIDQAVNAPVVLPKDVNEIELGPFAAIQTDNPQGVGRVNLNIPNGLFPESQILAQEQRTGSRYPEGRSGSIDASIVTGQGVQALMGTFDTQVQTFQRLNASALTDVIELCFRMDEAYFGNIEKTRYVTDNGAPRQFTYTPLKDIAGNYTIDVTYGAIAGLDPNRGLVFILQALAGKLISTQTARKYLPVDLNPGAEERQIALEEVEGAVNAAISQLPLAIPQMAMMGQDPRQIVLQIAQASELLRKGKPSVEALTEVFAPKEQPQPEAAPAPPALGGGAPAPSSPAQDLLMSLTGLTAGGAPNMQSTVSRMEPI